MSERILDAALELAAASGVQSLTMDAVAQRAGVGRMTVYRRFGGKVAMLTALGAREARRCIAELDSATPPEAPMVEQVAAGFVVGIRLTREHPLIDRLVRCEPETVLAALTQEGGSLFIVIRTYMTERLSEARQAGVIGEDVDVQEAAELLVRLGISFALLPDSLLPLDDERRLREIAERMLVPIVEEPKSPIGGVA
ncbi:MAG TPA: TetR/AcrR family transcriptional regulator [Solirubrobacterales bacterium]